MNKQIKPIAVVIPGFGESETDEPYRELISFLTESGYNTKSISIKWDRTTWTGWVKQVLSALQEEKINGPDLLFGFSFGALLALMAENEIKPKRSILCSVSPYFSSDLPKLPAIAYKILGKKRMASFENIKLTNLPPANQTKRYFLIAEKDLDILRVRCKKLANKLNGELIEVPEAEHYLGEPQYIDQVKKIIKKIRPR